jgi:predicted metal-dependent peptidase
MRQATVFDKAKATIVLDHPFFGSILLKYPILPNESIKTLAVTNRGRIYYNPKFVEALTVQQVVWALCHEAMHVVGQHAQRLHNRKHRKWNFATDAWINDTLDAAKIGERIPNTVDIPGSKDRTSDEIYNGLPDDPPGGKKGQPGSGDCGGGSGDDPSKGSGEGDDSDGPQWMDGDPFADDIMEEGPALTDSEMKEMEAEAKVAVAQAAQAAKTRGKMPGALQKFVDQFIESRVPWHDKLERYMVGFAKADYSWTRPNRRFIGQGIYLPSVGNVPRMGTVVIQKDISGSVSQKESQHFDGHTLRIVQDCHPEKIYILYTDSRVAKVDEFGPDDEVTTGYWSGGGTDMTAGIRWCEENGIEPDVFITLTDGYTPFPEHTDFPTVWVISNKDIVAPTGETIHFEMEV